MEGLEIDGLTVDLGKFRLDGLTCRVRKGCITGLIGRNGAGKSTLIRTIMRQQNVASGSILYNGKRFADAEAEILSSVACVFDAPHFNTYAKAKKIIKYYAAAYKSFDMQLCDSLMEKFRLPKDGRIVKYSFGMQRKFCLVLALAQRPKILILDEPTSGVDPYDRGEVVSLIQEYMLDEGNTVLFSTHVTEDLDKIADYVIMLDDGKIVLDNDKEFLTENYRLVTCAELTPQMKLNALGVRKNAFGYSFLTTDKELSGEGVQLKIPTLEEIFVHLLNGRHGDVL